MRSRSRPPSRGIRRDSSGSSCSTRRPRMPTSDSSAALETGPARRLPVSGDAPVRAGRSSAWRRCSSAAAGPGAVFVHCGVLTVGVRQKLGLPSPFDLRLGDPLAVAAVAARFPTVPVIMPHFGAGILPRGADGRGPVPEHPSRHVELERLDQVPSRPDARGVFRQALAVAGPERLLFGTDSSFFPRGWQRPIFDAQRAALDAIGGDVAGAGEDLRGQLQPVVCGRLTRVDDDSEKDS